MVNDQPDPVRFLKVACDLIVAAAKAAKGEHPALRRAENVRLSCGRKVMQRRRFGSNISGTRSPRHTMWTVLCGYPLGSFQC